MTETTCNSVLPPRVLCLEVGLEVLPFLVDSGGGDSDLAGRTNSHVGGRFFSSDNPLGLRASFDLVVNAVAYSSILRKQIKQSVI